MGWEPYRPPWYPKDLPAPFVSIGGSGGNAGKTHYEEWCDKIGAKELQRRIRAWREGARASG